MRYEYQEVLGKSWSQNGETESGNDPVTLDEINEEARKGWRFVCYKVPYGKTAIMEREVQNPSLSLYQASKRLRAAQKACMADRGNNELGAQVASAAYELDSVIEEIKL
jgi:hypothetical protein